MKPNPRNDTTAIHQLAETIHTKLAAALQLLHQLQPGYPTGNNGPGPRNQVSDPTGELATGRASNDPARQALEQLTQHLHLARIQLEDAERIIRSWQPPTGKWRNSLTDQATDELGRRNEPWCQSCLRTNTFTPPRTPGSKHCRWCADLARITNTDTPPLPLVERHNQGRRITNQDIERHTRPKD